MNTDSKIVKIVHTLCQGCKLDTCFEHSSLCTNCAIIVNDLRLEQKQYPQGRKKREPDQDQNRLAWMLPDAPIYLTIDDTTFKSIRQCCLWYQFATNPDIQKRIIQTTCHLKLKQIADQHQKDTDVAYNELNTLGRVLWIRYMTNPLDCTLLLLENWKNICALKFATEETKWERIYRLELTFTRSRILCALMPHIASSYLIGTIPDKH